jgi:hypothetical protein
LSAFHLVYGLNIEANVYLPGVLRRSNQDAIDVRVSLKEFPAFFPKLLDSPAEFFYSGTNSDENGEPTVRVARLGRGQYCGFFYADGARFAVARDGSEIWGDWPEGYTLEDASTYLVGPIIAYALRLRGATCLHASAIAVDNQAIALMGAPGAGKSTTAAAFAQLRVPVLSDDIVALAGDRDQFLVQPGYPRLNLWPDSVRVLFGSDDALPLITPTWGKRYMPLEPDGFASQPLPLGAIYILDERDASLSAPVIEEIAGPEALMALVSNTYGNYLLSGATQKHNFDVLSRVVAQTPVRRVRPMADPVNIYALCNAIEADARKISAGTQAVKANS